MPHQRHVRVLLQDVVFSDDGVPRLKVQFKPGSATESDTTESPTAAAPIAHMPSPCSSSAGTAQPSHPSSRSSESSGSFASCENDDDHENSQTIETLQQRLDRVEAFVCHLHGKSAHALREALNQKALRPHPPALRQLGLGSHA